MNGTSESPRQSVKARRKLKDESGVASKYTMAIKQQREMMRPSLSPSSANSGFLSADMDQILAPTFSGSPVHGGAAGEGGGSMGAAHGAASPRGSDSFHMLNESNSADSIIRRVEQEIAAARKAASGFNSPNNNNNSNRSNLVDGKEDFDDAAMANILNTTSGENSDHHFHGEFPPDEIQLVQSSDSSKDRALDIIRDEFQADLDKEEAEQAKQNASTSSIHRQDLPRQQSPNVSTMSKNSASPKQQLNVDTAEPKSMDLSAKDDRVNAASPTECTPAEEKKIDSPQAASTVSNQNQRSSSFFSRTFARRSPGEEKNESPTFPIENEQKKELTIDSEDGYPLDESKENSDAHPGTPQPPTTPGSAVSTPERPHRTPTPSTKAQARDNTADRMNAPSPRDPEGNYTVSSPRTPPRDAHRKMNQPSPRQVGMTRTRELLDNLKEQRESIVSRSSPSETATAAAELSPKSPAKDSTAVASPTFRRATRAKELMRSSMRSNRREVDTNSNSTQQQQQEKDETTPSPVKVPSPSKDAMNVAKRVTIQSPDDAASAATTPTAKESPRRSAREVAESISRQSTKIRFRNPFPVIKSPMVRREAEAIIADHSMGLPEMPVRWVRPKKELRQLIVAAMGTSLPRRSNACGALKVLTKNKKNQMTLVRTDGFLGALIFAASQSINGADRDLAIDARTRAVSCLKNVCDPKDNRVVVFSHPGVVECLAKVIKSDTGEGRAMAAAALALLAKTPGCREGLAHTEEVIDVLAKVLRGVGLMIEEEETSMPLCPTPKTPGGRKVDDDVSAFSDHTHHDDDVTDDEDDDDDDDDDSQSEGSSLLSAHEGPPPEVLGPREITHVDSIKTQTEERQAEFVMLSRSNACAALLHLSKHCAVSQLLCHNPELLHSLLTVSRETMNPIHTKCLEILSNLTRFPANNGHLTRQDGVVETLVGAASSPLTEVRMSALRSLQNMSADPSSKAMLATGAVLNLLTASAMRKDATEKEIAVAALYNITTEPSAVTAITNTKNVVATLVHLAHSPDSSSEVRLLACEALATISLWLQTLAGTGKVPEGITNIPLPSQKTTGWERWD